MIDRLADAAADVVKQGGEDRLAREEAGGKGFKLKEDSTYVDCCSDGWR